MDRSASAHANGLKGQAFQEGFLEQKSGEETQNCAGIYPMRSGFNRVMERTEVALISL